MKDYPGYSTETERVSNLSTLQLIEVTPGWYIDEIAEDDWWFMLQYDGFGSPSLTNMGITNDPISAQDFSRLTEFIEPTLKALPSARLVFLEIDIKIKSS